MSNTEFSGNAAAQRKLLAQTATAAPSQHKIAHPLFCKEIPENIVRRRHLQSPAAKMKSPRGRKIKFV